jgi:hypothetical protein
MAENEENNQTNTDIVHGTPVSDDVVFPDIEKESENTISQEFVTEDGFEPEDEKELTEEEKRELIIRQLKNKTKTFHPIKYRGKTTINQFGESYKKKRQKKNKQAKASRKANRKK